MEQSMPSDDDKKSVSPEKDQISEHNKNNELEKSKSTDNRDLPSDDKSCAVSTDKSSEETKTPKENHTMDEANLHYEDGVCIYTEPESKCQYIWDEGKQEWVPRNSSNNFSDKDYEFDGKTYTYTDKETSIKYIWDTDKNEWEATDNKTEKENVEVPKKKDRKEEEEEYDSDDGNNKPKEIAKQDMTKGHYGYENDTHTYTDPSDGSKYFWDKEKNAWFPKVDEDFLAQYQMNYGFVDSNENQPKTEEKVPEPAPTVKEETLKRKAPQPPAWFDVGQESTKVYVSGLPLDITETEFVDVMQKCGLVMRDIESGKMKVKVYLDPETSLPKGDALCTYIKKESVDLALNLLDGYDVRGHRITVERAKFTMKGDYNPSLKPKKKKKDKEKLKKMQEKLFDWRPDKMRGERSKHEKIVIIKNLFDPVMFNKDVKLILEYQQDLRDECLKCGGVKKVTIYDRHPEGVAQVNFKEVEAADACVQLLNGRWFGQRKITAETWDGKTKYKITETDEQIKARIQKWEKFLETGEAAKEEKQATGKAEEIKDTKEESVSEKDESKDTKVELEVVERDSDEDTRSSVESDYDTDEERKTS